MHAFNPLERRNNSDRRNSMQATEFPLITSNGMCIKHDRRRMPDRRLAKIQVGEAEVRGEEFDALFAIIN